jgi:hypothetical protein
MANAEHVKIFKEGIPIWNKWRREHPEIIPDLRGSDLSGSDLRGSDLSGSDLRWSDLRGSNLSGSNLRGSNLSGSNLRGSNLSGSDLRWSDLSGSDLRWSNLSGSDLSGTSVIEVITLLPFTIVVMTDKRVRIGCGAPKTIKACLKYTEDEAFAKGLPRERYQLYRAILGGLLK